MTKMLKTKTVKLVSVHDWDEFVVEVYGKPYMFQQQDGCKERGIERITAPCKNYEDFENTEIPFVVNGEEMGVSFETWLNTSPEDTLKQFKDEYEGNAAFYNDLFWERNFYPDVDMIVNDLYSKGLLEADEYTIVIDW
jgi:arginyl-tRNA synthetase